VLYRTLENFNTGGNKNSGGGSKNLGEEVDVGRAGGYGWIDGWIRYGLPAAGDPNLWFSSDRAGAAGSLILGLDPYGAQLGMWARTYVLVCIPCST